jgi:hypothetical protein
LTAANSVVNGIHPKPNQFTMGEGPVTGQEVQFNVLFTTPIVSLDSSEYSRLAGGWDSAKRGRPDPTRRWTD